MSMKADYDESQPFYIPIILSIIATIIIIIVMTVGVIFYFKISLSKQYDINENNFGLAIELEELRKYEKNYLEEGNEKKVTINEAMLIISNSY